MTSSFESKLFSGVIPDDLHSHVKVSIIGTGRVGMAVAYSLLLRGTVSELALVDTQPDKLKGEMMDLQHGQAFLKTTKILASTDYSVTDGSKICIIAAGAKVRRSETDEDLLEKHLPVFKSIIPKVVKHNPNCILVVVSNPVDILTWAAWKLSGFPQNRVLGTGTMLDSSRFRFLLSEKLGIAPKSCHGYLIGEVGENSVPVWSSVNVAGTHLKDLQPHLGDEDDSEHWSALHKSVVGSANESIALKGYTNWSIGIMVATLVNSILKNQKVVYAITTLAKGYHGIEDEIFLSLPCVVGEKGIAAVFNQNLTDEEVALLKHSARHQKNVTKLVEF